MLTRELRRGNLILHKYEVSLVGEELWLPLEVDEINLIDIIGIHGERINVKRIMPIMLSEDLMEYLGFFEWSEGNFKTVKHLNKGGWSEKFNYNLPSYSFSTYCASLELNFVHELQNTYFALTKTELEVSTLSNYLYNEATKKYKYLASLKQ